MTKKRLIKIGLLAGGGAILLCVGIVVILMLTRPRSLQDWIGSQLQTIANSYLKPKLSFTDLTYEYPLGVSLKNLHLTADDPAHPGKTIDIIACKHAQISLAEIPSVGKPIVIEKIVLDEPLISAVAIEPRSKNFVGFSDLIRGSSTSSAPEPEPGQKSGDSAPPKKLSDVFKMRLVQLTDGKIVYDPRIPGTVPMMLDKINTTLNIEPTDGGWYKLDTDIARKPVFDLHMLGKINLDSFSVQGVDINLLTDLGQENLSYLPPELQELLKKYDARGKLHVEIAGSMPVMDPMKGDVKASVELDRANIAMGGLRLPVDNLELKSEFKDGSVSLSSLKIATLGGTVNLSGGVALNDRMDADLLLNVAGVELDHAVTDPSLVSAAGAKLGLDFKFTGSLMSILGKAPAKAGEPLASIGLKNFEISADDPANPGQKIDLVACKNLAVAMTQPIVSGKPIVIDKIILDQPVISAVAAMPESTQFVGVPTVVTAKSSAAVAPSAPAAPVAVASASAPKMKLGDFLRVKTFQLNDAKIIYDPRIAGTQRMHLDDINTAINIDPNDPGSYKLNFNIARQPVFSLGVKGEINVDDPGLQNLNFNLHADLISDQLDFLPPQLQLILKQTKASGKLDVNANASLAMSDPSKGKAQVDVNVQNIDLSQGNVHIPVDNFSMSARLEDGKILQTMKISALKNVFEFSGSVALNSRLDTDMTTSLKDVEIESLLAALDSRRPPATTSTKLTADIEIKSPLMVAMGAVAGAANEPVASVIVRNFHLSTDNPTETGSRFNFVDCDKFDLALRALPTPGKPVVVVDHVLIEHPIIRAIALAPGSNEFAGFWTLQNIVATQSPAASAGPATPTTLPSPAQAEPAPARKLGDVFRLGKFSIADASIYYDPRLTNTYPLALQHITTNVNLDPQSASSYDFDTLIAYKTDLNLHISGRMNADTMMVDPLKVDLGVVVAEGEAPNYLPPQLQQLIQPYNAKGSLAVNVAGKVPLLNLYASDLNVNVKLDDVEATAGNYGIPITHVRLPIQVKDGKLTFLDPTTMGGPLVEALSGTAKLTGGVILNDRFDTSLTLNVDGMLLQSLITQPKKDLAGEVHVNVQLINAPLLVILAKTKQTDPAAVVDTSDLPANWGSANIDVTHANLAGVALVQGMTNLAKSAFSSLFKTADNQVTNPKETAKIVCTFDKDHINISNVHYEGEDLAIDGKGYISLAQYIDLTLTGGPWAKLGGLGSVGDWFKQASDSLLYYHVYGPINDWNNVKIEAKGGDGKPIVEGAKNIADKGVKAIDNGLNKAGDFLHGLFNHDDKDKDKN